jgi:hypothetical protein
LGLVLPLQALFFTTLQLLESIVRPLTIDRWHIVLWRGLYFTNRMAFVACIGVSAITPSPTSPNTETPPSCATLPTSTPPSREGA